MGLAFADYDSDGWPDAFVSNDAWRNFLFRNRGDGTFEETGLYAGVAYVDAGRPVSGMGADFKDYDGDGRPDIFMTALSNETFPLFRNEGNGMFREETFASRLGGAEPGLGRLEHRDGGPRQRRLPGPLRGRAATSRPTRSSTRAAPHDRRTGSSGTSATGRSATSPASAGRTSSRWACIEARPSGTSTTTAGSTPS